MPNHGEHRFFRPSEWRKLLAVIRFGRAKSRCEGCERSNSQCVFCLADGRWWDDAAVAWRDGSDQIVCFAMSDDRSFTSVRTTRVMLTTARRHHDTVFVPQPGSSDPG